MPLFAAATQFDQDVEKATSEMNTTEDWSLILDICEKVARTQNGARDCLKSIVKRLNHRVPFVSMQALTLLDACVNNCGRPFLLEICSRDFVSECRTLISQRAHPKVAQKLRLMIKRWAEMPEFKDDPALNLIPSLYDSLKKEGHDFTDSDSTVKKTLGSSDMNGMQQEEDDIAKAIALSLQDAEKQQGKATSLYPTGFSAAPASSASYRPKEVRQVRALYDFEAAEDNELTFKAGELINVLDDSDPNWWKGSNQRGEGLFPANFVTADLTVEPEESKPEKKTVQFSEEVEVKTVEPIPEEVEIDEGKIDEALQIIQNADPTGETQPDSQELLALEEQCKAMGPLIDAELEKVDRKHATLVEINQKVMEALQMYHTLMKENPGLSYSMKPQPQMYGPGSSMMLPPQQQQAPPQHMYNGHPQYLPQGQMAGVQGQMGANPVMPPQPQSFSPPPTSNHSYATNMPTQAPLSSYPSMSGGQVSMSQPGPASFQPAQQSTNNSYGPTPQQSQPLPMYQAPPPQQQPLL